MKHPPSCFDFNPKPPPKRMKDFVSTFMYNQLCFDPFLKADHDASIAHYAIDSLYAWDYGALPGVQ